MKYIENPVCFDITSKEYSSIAKRVYRTLSNAVWHYDKVSTVHAA